MAGLAAARGRRRPGRPADHVRARPAAGALPELELPWLSGLRGLGAGPDRQRRRRAAPARRLGRGARRPARSPGRPACPATTTPGTLQVALLDYLEGALAGAGQRAVGDARRPRRHFVHSKVMAWVAFDRMVARRASTRPARADVDRWEAIRDADPRRGARPRASTPSATRFTQSYGTDELDAALLLIPRVGFLPGDDPRVARHDRRHPARAHARTVSCCATGPAPARPTTGCPAARALPGVLVLAGRRAARGRPARRGDRAVRAAARRCATTSACWPRSGTRWRTAARQHPAGVQPRALINAARHLSGARSAAPRLRMPRVGRGRNRKAGMP